MGYSPFEIKELRAMLRTTNFDTDFTDADDSDWSIDGTTTLKLRCYDVELDLDRETVPDASIQQNFYGKPPVIPTRRTGSVKFKMHFEGGSTTTTANTLATMLSYCMGGLKSPSGMTDKVEAGSNVYTVNATAHGLIIGQAVAIGYNGTVFKAGVIREITANNYTFTFALPDAPSSDDDIQHAHTVYFDPLVEKYMNFLFIGHYAGTGATDDPIQINCIGCSGKATIGGLGVDETPFVEFEFPVGHWRNEPYASQATLDITTASSGENPVPSMTVGHLLFGDNADYTRTTLKGGEIEITPNIELEPLVDYNGNNRIGGWIKVPSESGPTVALTRYWGDMPGLRSDFENGTAKQFMIQLGNGQLGVGDLEMVVIDVQKAYLDKHPALTDFNKLSAIRLELHADSGGATAYSTDAHKLQDSPVRVHFIRKAAA